MLENYDKDFKPKDLLKSVQKIRGLNYGDAVKYVRERVPEEKYYQKKIIKGLKQKFPDAYIVKIAQGMYSNSGIPDVMCIYKGHYFGFEVKRPMFGKPSDLQKAAMALIRKAGGTAEVVSYPEEAFAVIEAYEQERIFKNGK